MARCPNCGGDFQGNMPVCPFCGTDFRSYNAAPATPAVREKKSKAPYVVLFSLLGVLVALGVVACLLVFKSEPSHKKLFKYSYSQFTDELNRVIAADGTRAKLDPSRWKFNEADGVMEYIDKDFSIFAKTEKSSDKNSKLEKLTITPASDESGRRITAQSIIALSGDGNEDEIADKLNDLYKDGGGSFGAYNTDVGYDKDDDAFIITPKPENNKTDSKTESSEKSDLESVAAPTTENDPEPEYSDFVSNYGYVIVGDTYIFTDGETISRRTKTSDDAKTVVKEQNNRHLLSNGSKIYYVAKDGKKFDMKSISISGKDDETLFSLDYEMIPIHEYNNCLFYVRIGTETAEDYSFWKYDLIDKETKEFKNVYFTNGNYVISDNVMYCSNHYHSISSSENITAYTFNFDTEEWTKALDNCVIKSFSYMKGINSPFFETYSFETNKKDVKLKDHYLYTLEKGKLNKLAELPENAYMSAVSLSSNQAIICQTTGDNTYYLFDISNSKSKELLSAGAKEQVGTFTDYKNPDDMYLFTYSSKKSNVTIKSLYKVENGELVSYEPEKGFAGEYLSPFVSDGYLMDCSGEAQKLAPVSEAVEPSASYADSDYSGYIGTWYKDLGNSAGYSAVIGSVEGDKIKFNVSFSTSRAAHLVISDTIEGTIVNGKVDFTYKDSFLNTGSGTLELLGDHLHVNVKSNFDGNTAAMSYDADLYDHNDSVPPTFR